MPLTSNVPAIEFTPSGLVIPTESDILSGVISDIDAAFGGGINPALESPQGQIASSQTKIIADKNSEFAYIVNQVDPQFSSGRFQDGIGRIYMLNRKPASSTSVQCVLTGAVGTPIPAGTLAQDTSNNTYYLTGSVVIGLTGQVTAEFQNVLNGPIPCPSNTLNIVYQSVSGWDAINNPTDGTLGANEESRNEFEYRRLNSVEKNANGTPGAIYANVFDIDDVIDCYVIDNSTNATVNTGSTNYPLLPHSVYVAVVGGVDLDVATAIWRKKDLGCDMNGNTTVQVTDQSGYGYPYPTYNIIFNRPASLPVKFAVNIVDNPLLPSNIVQLVKDAIISRFNGEDGTTRERIGALILASRYYGAIVSISNNVNLIDILIGTSTPTLTQVAVGIDQRPTISSSDITVNLI